MASKTNSPTELAISSLPRLEIVYKAPELLIPYESNAKLHSDEQIKALMEAIRRFGFNQPILIDGNDGILAGHGRRLAAIELKLPEVPTINIDHLDEAEKAAFILADNRLSEIGGGWDEEILNKELQKLIGYDFDTSVTGFDASKLKKAMSQKAKDADEIPEAPEDPIVSMGELWLLGEHRLLCGSSLDVENVKKATGGLLVDLYMTDPPYNVDYTGKTKDALKIQNDSMDDEEFRTFLTSAYACADTYMQPGAAFYIFHADSEGYNFRGACRDVNWQVRQCLIWLKNVMVMGRQDYHWKHEPCLYGWKSGAAHKWETDRKQTTILEFDRPTRSTEHPTSKPVDLIEYLVRNSSAEGDRVLDSFGGSGSTLMACEVSGRKNVSIELEPRFCDVIINRWQTFTGQHAHRASDDIRFDELAAR